MHLKIVLDTIAQNVPCIEESVPRRFRDLGPNHLDHQKLAAASIDFQQFFVLCGKLQHWFHPGYSHCKCISNSEIPSFFGLCSGSKLQAWENLGPKNRKMLISTSESDQENVVYQKTYQICQGFLPRRICSGTLTYGED